MRIENFDSHIATGEDNNSFVGIKIIGNHIHFYYPESYHFDPNDYERDDILDLLKTISIAKSQSKSEDASFDSHNNENDFAMISYIWIIEDYLKNGFFISNERIYKTNQRGKINWKKTLQNQPIVSGRNIIYSDLITEVKSPQDSALVEAHRYCVKKSLSLLGWAYGVYPETIELIADAEHKVPVYLDVIKRELDHSFDDERVRRLVNMKNVIIGLDEAKYDNCIVYGVDSYHYVFERMIDSIFGTEKIEQYYPKFKWDLKYPSDLNELPGPTIRPDTIMRIGNNNNTYIIDSKFYRYGSLDLSQTKGLPEATSIVKQIAYGRYVQRRFPKRKIYNVFILPYDAQGKNAEKINSINKDLVLVGKVYSKREKDKSYSTIYTFLIDLRQVVRTWNRIMREKYKKELVDILNSEVNRS